MKPLGLSWWDVMTRLTSETGETLTPLPWWERERGAIDEPGNVVTIILTPRQDGKTTFLLARAIARLLTQRDAYVVFVAPSVEQANAILKRKLRRPLVRFARSLGLESAIRFTTAGVECTLTGSTLEIIPAVEFTSLGRSVTDLLIDEGKGVSDAVFEALAPSVIGVGGQIIVCSTAGRPSGWLYELVQHPQDGVFVHRERENTNPFASNRVLAVLEGLFGWMNPAARERELHSEFSGDGQEFLSPGLITAAIDETLGEIATSEDEAFDFHDLSRKRDLTSRVVILRRPALRPERADHLVVASIKIWDPRTEPTGEVPFDEVRADLADLPRRFPNLRRVLVDEGSEAGSVLPFARAHPALSLIIEGFQAGPKSNMALWGSLAGRLHDRTLSIPSHQRLVAELRGLRTELFHQQAGWRVVDGAERLHRDVSVSLAGAVYAAGEGPTTPQFFFVNGARAWGGLPSSRPPSVAVLHHQAEIAAELERQKSEDDTKAAQRKFAENRQAEQLAAAAAREENSKRLRAEEAAQEARDRDLEEADHRRLRRARDERLWTTWR